MGKNKNKYYFESNQLKDLRKPDEFLSFFERQCNTNQRMTFDISSDGNRIYLGSQNGSIVSYSIFSGKIQNYYQAHDECINSIIIDEFSENEDFLISASGERIFNFEGESEKDSDESEVEEMSEELRSKFTVNKSSLKIWKMIKT